VHVAWAAIKEVFDIFWEIGACSPIRRQVTDLLFARNFPSQEQPEKTFWQRFFTAGSLGKDFLAFWDGTATESDSFFRIKDGAFPDE
jgi:hypothetical protein